MGRFIRGRGEKGRKIKKKEKLKEKKTEKEVWWTKKGNGKLRKCFIANILGSFSNWAWKFSMEH